MKILALLLAFAITYQSADAEEQLAIVRKLRVPHGGIQPQVVVGMDGDVHMVYFKGDAAHGDIFYVHTRMAANPFRSRFESTLNLKAPSLWERYAALSWR